MRCIDQVPECLFALVQAASSEDAFDRLTTEVTCGDRRVGTNSEETLVVARCHRREKLALPGRHWPRMSHHRLGELQEVPRARGIVGKEMPQIRLAVGLRRRGFEMRDEHIGGKRRWRAQENRDHRVILQGGATSYSSMWGRQILSRGVASIRPGRDIIRRS